MTVLGAHVALSKWTWMILVLGAGCSLLVWRSLATTWGWRPRPTLAALLLLTVALALTVTPDPTGGPARGLAPCMPDHLPEPAWYILVTGAGPFDELLNFVLLMPLTASLVLASGRWRPAAAVAVALPVTIELVQTVLPGRLCGIPDTLMNMLGALVGVRLGLALHRQAPRSSGRFPHNY